MQAITKEKWGERIILKPGKTDFNAKLKKKTTPPKKNKTKTDLNAKGVTRDKEDFLMVKVSIQEEEKIKFINICT